MKPVRGVGNLAPASYASLGESSRPFFPPAPRPFRPPIANEFDELDHKLPDHSHRRPSFSPDPRDWCIFCRICDLKEPNVILYQDQDCVVFNDHRPVAPNHFLVVTRHHIPNVRSLIKSDIPIIQMLWSIGQRELEKRGANLVDARLGFHKPPRNSVNHLHMHVISPASTLSRGEKKRFGLDTWYFVSVEKVLKFLENLD
ncbi:Hypothetical predicted protein [Cloeon dipterum]|uniref:Adenosine 5'-monophosphoramidase HINT3 n=1 Tax=Cloeon dipterum TaxID=197152 RepID=A0A8S1CMQ9_9INSE|nr:Hypothetical predicted protein [Cloeon dipterum]